MNKQNKSLTNTKKVEFSCHEPFDRHLAFQNSLNHLIRMGLMKGWKQHTWYRVQELENDPSGLWRGIQQEFLREIEIAKSKIRIDQEREASGNKADSKA